MPVIKYGKVTLIEGYKDGKVINRLQNVEESIPIHSMQELWDNIFEQVRLLKEGRKCVGFYIYADKHTHEPTRMVLVDEAEL